MNQSEFDKWLDTHTGIFPSVAEWIARLPDAETTLRHWQLALAPVSYADASEITSQMAVGEIDAPLAWEQRDQTAIIIRREAMKLRGLRRRRVPIASDRPVPSRHGGTFTPLRALLDRAETLGRGLRDGTVAAEEHAQKMEQVVHESKKGASDQRRYRCCNCNDAGLIICWHPVAVGILRSTGDLPRKSWTTMAVACGDCEAGRVFHLPEQEGGRRFPLPRFDSKSHCRLISGCGMPGERDADELHRWLAEDYLSPAMSGEFAAWNAR